MTDQALVQDENKMQIRRIEEKAQTAHLLIIHRCSNRGISCALI